MPGAVLPLMELNHQAGTRMSSTRVRANATRIYRARHANNITGIGEMQNIGSKMQKWRNAEMQHKTQNTKHRTEHKTQTLDTGSRHMGQHNTQNTGSNVGSRGESMRARGPAPSSACRRRRGDGPAVHCAPHCQPRGARAHTAVASYLSLIGHTRRPQQLMCHESALCAATLAQL